MVQPAVRIRSEHDVVAAARQVQTPSDVRSFEARGLELEVVRRFIRTPEWRKIRDRIMGDGTPPLGPFESLDDMSRLFRWSADGEFSDTPPSPEARGVFLYCAREVDAFARRSARLDAPVSPAAVPPAAARVEFVPGLGGERVAVPQFPSIGLSFADALVAVQAGWHIARAGWPGESYVTAQAGYPQGIGVNANTARATGLVEGSVAAFEPYLMMCRARSGEVPPRFAPWTPDQGDLFARDWQIVRRPDAES